MMKTGTTLKVWPKEVIESLKNNWISVSEDEARKDKIFSKTLTSSKIFRRIRYLERTIKLTFWRVKSVFIKNIIAIKKTAGRDVKTLIDCEFLLHLGNTSIEPVFAANLIFVAPLIKSDG